MEKEIASKYLEEKIKMIPHSDSLFPFSAGLENASLEPTIDGLK